MEMRKYRLLYLFSLMAMLMTSCRESQPVRIKIVCTSDVHGSFFPYDFRLDKPATGSLARVSSYLGELRSSEVYGDNVIFIDNGFYVYKLLQFKNITIYQLTQDQFLNIIDDLSNKGYLTYLTKKDKNAYIKCKFDVEYYYKKCSDGYAIVYLDELQKIMDYKSLHTNSINNTIILLVFAYFRNKIIRRPNELKPEERTFDGIRQRKKRMPEAISGNITAIAKELGLHKQTLSKAIDILECDLKLLVTDRAYRIKNENNEFRTLPTIFANAYKREDKYLLITDETYSRTEIELKAQHMKQHYQDYKIDKRKRKNKE